MKLTRCTCVSDRRSRIAFTILLDRIVVRGGCMWVMGHGSWVMGHVQYVTGKTGVGKTIF